MPDDIKKKKKPQFSEGGEAVYDIDGKDPPDQ